MRKCARLGDAFAGGRSFRGHRSFKAAGHRSFKAGRRQSIGGGASTTPGGGANGGGGGRAPAWLLLSGGEDGYVLWDLGRGRPLLMSLEESGPWVRVMWREKGFGGGVPQGLAAGFCKTWSKLQLRDGREG